MVSLMVKRFFRYFQFPWYLHGVQTLPPPPPTRRWYGQRWAVMLCILYICFNYHIHVKWNAHFPHFCPTHTNNVPVALCLHLHFLPNWRGYSYISHLFVKIGRENILDKELSRKTVTYVIVKLHRHDGSITPCQNTLQLAFTCKWGKD